jgi:hypothetical protein
VYSWRKIIEVDDVRTTALDAHDPIVVLGNAKGYVAPWIKEQSNKNNIVYEQSMEQAKRGTASIETIKYLSRADYFCLLIDGSLKIIT